MSETTSYIGFRAASQRDRKGCATAQIVEGRLFLSRPGVEDDGFQAGERFATRLV